MDGDQKNKAFRHKRAGVSHDKKKKAKAKRAGVSRGQTAGPNEKAFGTAGRSTLKEGQRAEDRKAIREQIVIADHTYQDRTPPLVIAVIGPANSGKSTLIKSLVRRYGRTRMPTIDGPVTCVVSRDRRFTFIEASSADLPTTIDAIKVADIALLTVRTPDGVLMDHLEILSIGRAHGLPKTMFVATFADDIKEIKELRRVRKLLLARARKEVIGAKVFDLRGLQHDNLYHVKDVHNLHRFIAVATPPRRLWRSTHPYVLVDRVVVTDPATAATKDKDSKDKKQKSVAFPADVGGDVSVSVYGYVRGTPMRAGATCVVPGAGMYIVDSVDVIPDPCPPPTKSDQHRRTLRSTQRRVYAPRCRQMGVQFGADDEGITIDVDERRVAAEAAIVDGSAFDEGGLGLLMALRQPRKHAAVEVSLLPTESAGAVGSRKGSAKGPAVRRLDDSQGLPSAEVDMSDDDDEDGDDGDAPTAAELARAWAEGDDDEDMREDTRAASRAAAVSAAKATKGSKGSASASSAAASGSGASAAGLAAVPWVGSAAATSVVGENAEEAALDRTRPLRWFTAADVDAVAHSHVSGAALRGQRGLATMEALRGLFVTGAEIDADAGDGMEDIEGLDGDGGDGGDSDSEGDADMDGGSSDGEDDSGDESDDDVADDGDEVVAPRGRGVSKTTDASPATATAASGASAGGPQTLADRIKALAAAHDERWAVADMDDTFRFAPAAATDAAAAAAAPADPEEAARAAARAKQRAAFDAEYRAVRGAAADERASRITGSTAAPGADASGEGAAPGKTKGKGGDPAAEGPHTRKSRTKGVDFDGERYLDKEKVLAADADANAALAQLTLERTELKHALLGAVAGQYVRLTLRRVARDAAAGMAAAPFVVIGGMAAGETRPQTVLARVQRHRWFPKLLNSHDPLLVSAGWARYQTTPLFALEDPNSRLRFLKYTPQHTHCMAVMNGLPLPVATGVCGFVNGLDTSGCRVFRVAMLGTMQQADDALTVVKKLKLVGRPSVIRRTTCFVQGMFTSAAEVEKFSGARIRTVSGLRGIVKGPAGAAFAQGNVSVKDARGSKDAKTKGKGGDDNVNVTPKEAKLLKGDSGAFRAAFEDKLAPNDVVFLRAWTRVEIPPAFAIVRNMTPSWTPALTRWQLKHQADVYGEHKAENKYVHGAPSTGKAAPRAVVDAPDPRLPAALEANLPFAQRLQLAAINAREHGNSSAVANAASLRPTARVARAVGRAHRASGSGPDDVQAERAALVRMVESAAMAKDASTVARDEQRRLGKITKSRIDSDAQQARQMLWKKRQATKEADGGGKSAKRMRR